MLTQIERLWLWATIHHPQFHKCTLTLNPPLISIRINFGRYCRYEIFSIDVRFYRPELALTIPYTIAYDYADAMKKQGIYIDTDSLIADIPF